MDFKLSVSKRLADFYDFADDIAAEYGVTLAQVKDEIRRQVNGGGALTTQCLLVWENVPESTQFFLIDADESLLEILKASQNKFVNSVDNENDEVNELSRLLEGELRKAEIQLCDFPLEIEGDVTVFHAGFLL